MKFKGGDKVRVICNANKDDKIYHCFRIGEIVEIKGCRASGLYVASRLNAPIEQIIQENHIAPLNFEIEEKNHAPIIYKVYDELKKHVGKENAISAKELCEMFSDELMYFSYTDFDCKCADRKLRKIMREIRRSNELEKIPCSCNKGYYFAAEKQEAQKAIDRLVNTAKNELKTAYTMAKKLGLDGQMKIQFGEYWKDTYHSLMEEDNGEDTETH